ncbi:MAG: hypothetical protein V3U76_03590 [Granulosicoccus sp.]
MNLPLKLSTCFPGKFARSLLIAFAVLQQGACASHHPPRTSSSPGSIAVIGVTARDSLGVGLNRSMLNRDFTALLEESERFTVIPASRVKVSMNGTTTRGAASGEKNYSELIRNYARTGRIAPGDMQRLMAARLPAAMAVIARVESDEVGPLRDESEAVRNRNDSWVTDRQRITRLRDRRTEMSAMMVNLSTGAIVWSRQYRVSPVNRSSYVQYYGSSFSASLAASLANTMVNGVRVPEGPPAPGLQPNIRSLLREVVRNLPEY